MPSKTYLLKKGDIINIVGKYFSCNLVSGSAQSVSEKSIDSYRDTVKRIDEFGEAMESEFHIRLIRKGKPLKRYQMLLDGFKLKSQDVDATLKANTVLSKMTMIVNSLRDVRSFNEDAFKVLKRNLVNETSGYAYWGFVFELLISSLLSKSKVNFSIPSRISGLPDICIDNNGADTYVECHALFPTAKKLDIDGIERKINYGIKNKEKKSYANGSCALFIDITNLAPLYFQHDLDDFGAYLPESSSFGNVTLFCNYMNYEPGCVRPMIGWNNKNYDSCSDLLKSALKEILPEGASGLRNRIDGLLSF